MRRRPPAIAPEVFCHSRLRGSIAALARPRSGSPFCPPSWRTPACA